MKKAILSLLFLFSFYPAFSQFEILRDDFIYVNRAANLELPENVADISMTLEIFRDQFGVGYSSYNEGMQAETRLDIHLDNRRFVRIWTYYSARNDKNYLYVYHPGARNWRLVELPSKEIGGRGNLIDVTVSLELSDGNGRLRISNDKADFAEEFNFRARRASRVTEVSTLAYMFLYDMEVMNGSLQEKDYCTSLTIDSLTDTNGQAMPSDVTALDRRGNPFEDNYLPLQVLRDANRVGDSSGVSERWRADRSTWRTCICIHDD